MANYDTSIRIDTKINTKSAIVQLERLENRMEKTYDTIISLRSKLDSLKDVKIPTQEYKEIQNQISVTEKKIADLLARQEKFLATGGKTSSSAYKKMEYDLEELRNSLPYLKSELQDLIDTGKAFTLGQDTEEFAKITQQLQYKEKEFSTMSRQHDILIQKIQKASRGYKKLSDVANKAFDSVGNMLKRANLYIDSFVRRIKEAAQKHLPFFRKELKGTKNSLSEFGRQLKNFALSLFSLNQIGKVVKNIANCAKEGFVNLYNENEKFKKSIESVKASLLTLKNAFAGAFAPIIEIAIPYIQQLIGWLTEAADLIGQFIAALTGRKTYIRAIKQSVAVVEDASGAAKEEVDSLNDETDAMNKQLSPLDKLNNLTSENIKKKADNVSDEKGSAGTDGIMFEEVPITNSILDIAERVKDILKNLFEPLKKAWDKEGKFVMDSWKYALKEVWDLVKSIGSDFLEVWQQDKTVKIFENLLHIIGDIGLIVGNLAHNFRLAWEESETGKRILEGIRDIIAVIIENIRHAVDVTVEWSQNLNFSPLLTKTREWIESLIPVIDALSGIVTDFYEKVILPLGKWVLEKGLPELLQVFIDFNNKVDWEALRKRLSDFWEHLEPFAETVGEGLILFIENVSNALADFLNSQEFKDFLTSVENWMDNVSAEDVASGLEKLVKGIIGLKAALLAFKVGGAISKGLTALIANLHTLAAVGTIAASIYVGIEFSKDFREWNDNIKKYGWDEGRRKAAEENPANPYRNGTAITQEDGSGVFDKWLENLKKWQQSNREARDAEKEAQNKWLEDTKEKLKSFGEFVKSDWNNSYVGQMINSFKDGSWKEALSLWGEDLKMGIKSVGEFIKDDWNNSYMGQMIQSFTDGSWKEAMELWGQDIQNAFITLGERISEKWETIKSAISGKLEEIKSGISEKLAIIKENWNNIWTTMSDKVTSIIQTIKAVIGSAISWISGQINAIKAAISGLSTAARNMTSGKLGSAMGGALRVGRTTYSMNPSVNAAIAGLETVEFPGYATGQVIPRTMRQHLAWLGDNNQETEIVSPLSTMKQAFVEALAETGIAGGNAGGGNNVYEFSVDGQVFFRIMEKYAAEYKKQHGGKIAFS